MARTAITAVRTQEGVYADNVFMEQPVRFQVRVHMFRAFLGGRKCAVSMGPLVG